MRIPCPLCGPRDRREFYYRGAVAGLDGVGELTEGERRNRDQLIRYLEDGG